MRTRTIVLPDLSSPHQEAWRPLAVRSSEPLLSHEADILVRACHYSKNGKSLAPRMVQQAEHFNACALVRAVNPSRILPTRVCTFWRRLYGLLP
jgi:hypothetical protein